MKQPKITAASLQPQVNDTRIAALAPLPSPRAVRELLPSDHATLVNSVRCAIHAVLTGTDDRLLLIIGPCSVHDPVAALEYAARLREQADRYVDDLLLVMRVYFEKPRTSIGWKGLINDPHLDGSNDIETGLQVSRGLLRDINALGVPCGTEFLDTVIPQYISDLIAWGAIGARTTESQIHRQLVSGLSCPVGFKNGTDGNVQVAAAAMVTARQPHRFLAVTVDGACALATSLGNDDTHVILRGGTSGPNYDAAKVEAACGLLATAGLRLAVMIDCSHANSAKDYRRQVQSATDVIAQVSAGDKRIIGLMVESNLVKGAQSIGDGTNLVYGQSVTDGCVDWDTTETLLSQLAAATQARRTHQVAAATD